MQKMLKGSWPLYMTWIIVLLSTIIISNFYGDESSSFYGIAETREIVVNFESSVEIKRINVTEGQSVEEGALLVELNSPDLMLKINHISHQLDQLRAQKGIDKSEIKSRIRQLTAEKAAKKNEIKNQITQLENQYNLNKSLLSGLKSIPEENRDKNNYENSPMELKIKSLKKELTLSVHPLKIQIELLKKTLNNSTNPIKIQVERLEEELKLLRDENSKLNIYAQISGIIGSVNFKTGEKVSPFSPILTLHTKTPSFIKGYIYEKAYSDISMEELVNVGSLTIKESIIKGCVVGIGARIVEYPVRLRKHPTLQIWGREVVIQIPHDNPFILGEKVLISTPEKKSGFADIFKNLFNTSKALAKTNKIEKRVYEEKKISPITSLKTGKIEASAILYLKDIKKYMVLSDDTPKNSPLIFLMDSHGKVTKESSISGLKKIRDMESVAQGKNGTLYISSSLNYGKKNKLKKSGKLLVSVLRKGENFSLLKKLNLYSLLKKHAQKENDTQWAKFILGAISSKNLDLEGMFYKGGALYLGFKAPLFNKQSLILRINEIDHLMETKKFKPHQVSIWRTINLKCDDNKSREAISDLFYFKETLYITGTPLKKKSGEKSGSLWKLDEQTGRAIRLTAFKNLQPEGIAKGEDKNTLMVCFDQGSNKKSKFCSVKVKK